MNITKNIRRNFEMNRNRRAVNRAIEQASTPSLRNELIAIASRSGYNG